MIAPEQSIKSLSGVRLCARAQQIRRRAKRRKEKLTRAMHFCFLSLLSPGTVEVSRKMEGGGGHKSKRLSIRVIKAKYGAQILALRI